MALVLIVSLVWTLLVGFVAARKMDVFLARGSMFDSPQGREHRGYLVFGSPETALQLRSIGYGCDETTTLCIDPMCYYAAFFALGSNDEQNLWACRKMKERDNGICIIARCHSAALIDVYRDVGADCVLQADVSLDEILAELRRLKHDH